MITTADISIKTHYDNITDAWTFIFGDNFHWGYFKSDDETLLQATDNLIDFMVGKGSISDKSKILDVGCGIGGPAFYLHEKFGCDLTGITISDRGAELAQMTNQAKGYASSVRFMVADILGDFSVNSCFDVIWIMEVSHLIKDKQRLFERAYELLPNGGELLLCDVIIKKEFSAFDILRHGRDLAILEKTFGKTKSETLEYYRKTIGDAGFKDVEVTDVSNNVYPTIEHWRRNIQEHYQKIADCMSKEKIDNFLASCNILDRLYQADIFGYGVVKAVKVL